MEVGVEAAAGAEKGEGAAKLAGLEEDGEEKSAPL